MIIWSKVRTTGVSSCILTIVMCLAFEYTLKFKVDV